MKRYTTIADIAAKAEVSTATVSRYLNSPDKVASNTAQKVEKAIQVLGYTPGRQKKKPSKNATMAQVANKAGVSKATVSRVMNDSNLVQEQTRQKVLEAMKDLNYRPNMIARNLRKQKTKMLGIILPDISNPFYSKVLTGIENVACDAGYEIVLMNTNYNEEREARNFQTLMERRAEGVLFMCHHLDEKKIQWLKKYSLPFVLISRNVEDDQIPYVNIDNFKGGYDATRHLISLGHKKIGLISGPFSDESSSLDRIAGYMKALDQADIKFKEDYLREGDFTFRTSQRLVKELLSLPEPPTAIFAVSDETAIGAIKGAKELGISVPQDLSIVGFDNLELSYFYNPALTTIAQPMTQMGKRSTEILLNIIENKKVDEFQVILPHKLIERDSTAEIRS